MSKGQPGSLIFGFGRILYSLGLPGYLLGGVFAAIVEGNSHGGGSALDYVLVIVPANAAIYSLIAFIVVRAISRLGSGRQETDV
jgi:hypothetical protein